MADAGALQASMPVQKACGTGLRWLIGAGPEMPGYALGVTLAKLEIRTVHSQGSLNEPGASKDKDVNLSKEPVFNVPGTVLAVLILLAAIHAVRIYLLSADDGLQFLVTMAFIPARYAGLANEIPGGELASVTSFFTHMLIHADSVHLLINSAWMLAFGSMLCRRMGSIRFLLFSLAGGAAGALLFLVMNPGLAVPVIGASGAVSAMMGGVMRILFSAIDQRRGYLLRQDPAAIPRMNLIAALRDRRIILSSLFFVAINIAAIVGIGQLGAVGAIAWEAHLGGYFFGFLAFALFDIATHKATFPQQWP